MKFATSEIRTSVTILSKIYQGLHLCFRGPKFLQYWGIDEAESIVFSSFWEATEESDPSDPLLGMTFFILCDEILRACKTNVSTTLFFEIMNKGTPEEELKAHLDERGSFLRLNVLPNRMENPGTLTLNPEHRIVLQSTKLKGAFAAVEPQKVVPIDIVNENGTLFFLVRDPTSKEPIQKQWITETCIEKDFCATISKPYLRHVLLFMRGKEEIHLEFDERYDFALLSQGHSRFLMSKPSLPQRINPETLIADVSKQLEGLEKTIKEKEGDEGVRRYLNLPNLPVP